MTTTPTLTLTEFLLAAIETDEAKFGPEPWLDPVGSVEEWSADAGNHVHLTGSEYTALKIAALDDPPMALDMARGFLGRERGDVPAK